MTGGAAQSHTAGGKPLAIERGAENMGAATAAEIARIREQRRRDERHSRAQRLEALRQQRHDEQVRLESLNVEIRQEKEDARYRRLEEKERAALQARKATLAKQQRRTKLEQMAAAHEVNVQARTEKLLAKRKKEAERAAQNMARQEAESDLRAQGAVQRTEIERQWSDTLDAEHVSVARQRALDAAQSAAQAKRDWDQLLSARRAAAAEEKRQTRAEIWAYREQERQDQETSRLAYVKLKADEEVRRITAEEGKARMIQERRERREEAQKAAAEQKALVANDEHRAISGRQVEKDGKKQQRAAMEQRHREDRQRRILGEKLHTERLRLTMNKLYQSETAQAFENGLRKKEERFGQPSATQRPTMQHATPSSPISAREIQPEESFGAWSEDEATVNDGIDSAPANGDDRGPKQSLSAALELPNGGSAAGDQSYPGTELQSTVATKHHETHGVLPQSSRLSALSQTSLGSRSITSHASRLHGNPNSNPPAVTITPRGVAWRVSEYPSGTSAMVPVSPKSSSVAEAESPVGKPLMDEGSELDDTGANKATDPDQTAPVVAATLEQASTTSAVPPALTDAQSRMACLEQGIEYRPLKPPVMKLPAAALDPPPRRSVVTHPGGAGLFATDAEIGPSNALPRRASQEELYLQQPAGPRSFTTPTPRSIAAAIAAERSAVLQERTTSGLARLPRRTLCPVDARGLLTPRSPARLTLDARQQFSSALKHVVQARIVLAAEWQTNAFAEQEGGVARPGLEPLPRPKQSSAKFPNSRDLDGGCGRQSAVAAQPVPNIHLGIVPNPAPKQRPKPPPKPPVQPRVQAAKQLRRIQPPRTDEGSHGRVLRAHTERGLRSGTFDGACDSLVYEMRTDRPAICV